MAARALVFLLALILGAGVLLAFRGAEEGGAGGGAASPASSSAPSPATVSVRVFDPSGTLVGPVTMPAVRRTDEEWRKLLTPEQFQVLRESGTERSGSGVLLHNDVGGVYTCAGCKLPLFVSESKFDSGTGWPSFFRSIAKENVVTQEDRSRDMVRGEIRCARCDGHLGHVFDDGPAPTGLRYCLNSAALGFTPESASSTLADPTAPEGTRAERRSTAVFAGGCFWCVEAVFEELDGVLEVISGYAGGTKESANYEAVSTGDTKHAEAVEIIYDPSKISYVDLLRVHFATHDPTQIDRQGKDIGPQYRSTIFFRTEEEKALAQAMIEDLDAQKVFAQPVVTTLEPLGEFYEAESRHQNYVCNNPAQGYVRAVALPKVEKVRKLFKDRLKQTAPAEK